ncbi:MAG TPA: SRPBCC family protein [Allosphingosinicella sp.]|nr:SRPBCC family protein [Allosphingosinicella sp.]
MNNPNFELSVTRLIDAPPETVYRVWTERPKEWFVPKPWTTSAVEWDLRAGGRMFTEMRGPDGEREGGEGVFLEVVPNRRIVFTNLFQAGWVPQPPSGEGCDFALVADFAFEVEGAGTRYTASARHFDEESLKKHGAMGFEQGWNQCSAQLAELAEAEAGRPQAA